MAYKENQKRVENIEEPNWDHYLPGISVDCVIFGYHNQQLKILILEYKNSGIFALPGGFIHKDEELEEAASRTLLERTGLSDIYLNQFHTFGSLSRASSGPMRKVLTENNHSFSDDHFLLQRFISVSYYALVDFRRVKPVADMLSDSCQWYDVNNLPELMLDHNHIYETALQHLRDHIDNSHVGQNLLDTPFTMGELQSMYETILGKKLKRTGFHRKMMLSGRLKRLGKKKTGKAHRAPFLYTFSK
jgi:ADP-ribose pyrophosphatase YjhB (NUDIX family)